ncbi:D-tagatose-bisphosphate aldolase, class II, non-catalytic subunit [Duganella radicis]|uniref:D-tagatose-bisphosphate aldolase, class II, non-catalytic subunit n=1 Tax=Duganella radicis TaxID=551988 RepID=A0A6L6PD89_9BURK|nr:D-tagatose-bisphosphate aldolase, class II, non-catalytic subunit [Duganella radicis]MTV36883.1 D-tagatose-bisphosphate aldolase, class II, non-catalytic subunit [Duganella radicis]
MKTTDSPSPVQHIIAAHRRGEAAGLYSVCCSHPSVLRAAMRVATTYDTVLLVEATSNQVDQFGGYTGMTPTQFVAYVHALAREHGFPLEKLVLGGDHLGPNAWQELDAATAMGHAETLIAAYAAAGFHKIHLDCSMRCADDPQYLSDETIAARSARLCIVAEQAAEQAGLPPPVYVIGTEVPIPGGEANLAQAGAVTSPKAAQRTLDVHRQAFMEHKLHSAWRRVIAMVVQPGVDFDHSQIQHYDAAQAAELSAFVAGQPGIVFEAHSTDYQRESALHQMVRDHFAILKVGPAATFALREGFVALCQIEEQLVPAGQASRLMQVLDETMLAQPRHWAKHYPGTSAEQRLLRRYGLSDRCRYYWGEAPVVAAVEKLVDNLDALEIPLSLLSQYLPEQYLEVLQGQLPAKANALLEHKIGRLLAQYARACNRNAAADHAAQAGAAAAIC